MERRDFIISSSVASSALWMPRFLHLLSPPDLHTSRKLVVIQLAGGNDGLNTFVPYLDDIYYRSRPGIGLGDKEVLKVAEYQGFHNALEPLRPLYDQGQLSIVNAVGYPNPDRSHFRSMDIWQTGNLDERATTGWIGRYLDHTCNNCTPHRAVELGQDLSLALEGEEQKGIVLENPRQLQRAIAQPHIDTLLSGYAGSQSREVDYMYKTLIDTRQSASYLAQLSQQGLSGQGYPPTPFGRDMKVVADLILAGGTPQVYYVSLSGFDTHIRQKATHTRQLSQLATSIRALTDDLKRHGKMQEVLILCFSEFGRRVKQNASGGTDHGAGNNMFLIAAGLKTPGFYNAPPDLSDLEDGDVRYRVDFRQVYAEVLEKWLDVTARRILGREMALPGIV